MNKRVLMIGLGMILALPVTALHAAVANSVQLTGHVPAVLARLQSKGHLAATNLDLAIGLPLRNREALTNLLQQINDPASPNYHNYLTPGQFAEQFGPTEQDYQAVADFARQNGLTVTHAHGNRMLLDVRGKSTDIEKAFGITFNVYKHPTENRDFFAADTDPSVPANLKIQDVSGLENYDRPRFHYKLQPALGGSVLQAPATVKHQAGSGQNGNYIGDDFRNSYIPGSPLKGSGQTVALVQFDGYLASDIAEYETMAGRTNVPLQNVLIDGFNGQPTGDGGEVEVSLDIEMLVSMAPALSKIVVYEGNPFNFNPNDVFNQIAMDDSASQISCSWGWFGFPTGTTDQILQQMALQGQTFFCASGDGDAYPVGQTPFAPADSPYLTSVGGTTLTTTNTLATTNNVVSRVSETVWNWDVEYGAFDDGVGTSGGISPRYQIPYWQTNLNMNASQGSTKFRNFPDVALTGDNVLVVADGGLVYLGVGGTSCASPLWAGFTALINQQELSFNHSPIGFINPALYALAKAANYTNLFNDITTGSNTWSGSPNLFVAVTNYDLCAGLGTPNGTNLINALVGGPTYVFRESAPPTPYGTTMSALNGGSPNGVWALFIQDDVQFNTGIISNGWMVTLTLGSPVGAAADLDLALSASKTQVLPGANLVYYLSVTNFGGLSPATNVIVEDTLPSDVLLVSSNVSLGSIVRSGSTVTWTVGNLNTNAGGTLALTITTPNTAESLFDSAIVTASTPDPNPDDNSAEVTVIVGAPAQPQVAASYTGSSGAFNLSITGASGTTTIQASTNLQTWVPIYTTNSASIFTFTDPNKTNYPYRFYRVVTGQ